MKTKMSSPNIGSRYKIFRTINNECYLFDMDHSLKNVFFPCYIDTGGTRRIKSVKMMQRRWKMHL